MMFMLHSRRAFTLIETLAAMLLAALLLTTSMNVVGSLARSAQELKNRSDKLDRGIWNRQLTHDLALFRVNSSQQNRLLLAGRMDTGVGRSQLHTVVWHTHTAAGRSWLIRYESGNADLGNSSRIMAVDVQQFLVTEASMGSPAGVFDVRLVLRDGKIGEQRLVVR
jgi:prepilin-type N-terminal cleavage/methylation domain-containing protein